MRGVSIYSGNAPGMLSPRVAAAAAARNFQGGPGARPVLTALGGGGVMESR
ncbi:hypothetical protein LEMLEM_LOCUS4866 [Lemmus lemmus]